MTKSFTSALNGSPAALIKKGQPEARKAGAEFDGDTVLGRFKGKGVVGYYSIIGTKVKVTVTHKPILLPWALVESRVREFFTSP